jgi:membrane protein
MTPWAAGLLERADSLQQRHAFVGFPVAVVKKYTQDQGSRLAAMLTYYGFLGLFPLLLLAVWVISEALASDPGLRDSVVEEIAAPGSTLGVSLENALDSLSTSGLALVVAVLGLVLSATGAVLSLSVALNQVWAVPFRSRFGLVSRYVRVLSFVVLFVLGVVAVAVLGALAGTVFSVDAVVKVSSASGAFVVSFALILVSSRWLTARPPAWTDLWLGAVLGAAVIAVVLAVGSSVLVHLVARSSPVYGALAAVLGVFTLLFLTAQAYVFSLEVSTVRAWSLWPRSLDKGRTTEADRRALQILGHLDERIPTQSVSVTFDRNPHDEPDRSDPGFQALTRRRAPGSEVP